MQELPYLTFFLAEQLIKWPKYTDLQWTWDFWGPWGGGFVDLEHFPIYKPRLWSLKDLFIRRGWSNGAMLSRRIIIQCFWTKSRQNSTSAASALTPSFVNPKKLWNCRTKLLERPEKRNVTTSYEHVPVKSNQATGRGFQISLKVDFLLTQKMRKRKVKGIITTLDWIKLKIVKRSGAERHTLTSTKTKLTKLNDKWRTYCRCCLAKPIKRYKGTITTLTTSTLDTV